MRCIQTQMNISISAYGKMLPEVKHCACNKNTDIRQCLATSCSVFKMWTFFSSLHMNNIQVWLVSLLFYTRYINPCHGIRKVYSERSSAGFHYSLCSWFWLSLDKLQGKRKYCLHILVILHNFLAKASFSECCMRDKIIFWNYSHVVFLWLKLMICPPLVRPVKLIIETQTQMFLQDWFM